jgi:hypothetical protein
MQIQLNFIALIKNVTLYKKLLQNIKEGSVYFLIF